MSYLLENTTLLGSHFSQYDIEYIALQYFESIHHG